MNPTPDPAEIVPKKSQGRTLEWLARNPVIGLAGIVASVIAVPLTIFFGVQSVRNRELLYGIYETKTTIVKSGQSSDLHVLYKGQDVSTDVTALQVAVWNHGNESIKPENFVTVPPITLSTSPKVPILEARLKQVQRSVSQIGLDTSHIATGSVSLTWKILEHNDGAVIQLIVAGPPTVTVHAEGVVEGLVPIRSYNMNPDAISGESFIVAIIVCLLGIGGFVYAKNPIEKMVGRKKVIFVAILTIASIAFLLALLRYVAFYGSAVPPAFR
jgi:hypothetical protein